MVVKCVVITISWRDDKKFVALIDTGDDKIYAVHFGAVGYEDYTNHKDDVRKQRYIDRHITNEKWDNPFTAGFWAKHILWNKKSLKDSIKNTEELFGFPIKMILV